MEANFGRLSHAALDLQPGLNVITAPNESGKSTWCSFIRNMLYGLSPRPRGALAAPPRPSPPPLSSSLLTLLIFIFFFLFLFFIFS